MPLRKRFREALVSLSAVALACSQMLIDRQAALVRTLDAAQAGAADEQYGAQRTSVDIGVHKGFILRPAKLPADGARP
jgi:hypothetical protein